MLYFLHDGYGDGQTLERRGVAAEALAADAGRPASRVPDRRAGRAGQLVLGFSRRHRAATSSSSTDDLPRWVEAHYRVLPDKASRGITGISMGGYGAVKTALKHPGTLRHGLVALRGAHSVRLAGSGALQLRRALHVEARLRDRREDNSLDSNDVWNILWGLCFEEPPFSVELRAGTEDLYGLDGVAAQFGMLLNEHGVPTTVVLEPGGARLGLLESAR